ncbi:hypothetical protein EPUS_02151 [Endocarpon pusillum Z07020]|uniref:U6 snRNA phosphodiesterase n=1 Tax=Endocarpon pusillum (strain Z07020 / HMAS-L-300199) TaxID=1263415 RepID=U1HSS2_ENDPU|nr:uncharacterized protein EPUS_02151 [Endocarpon pusillum Z07020]ERF72264.1 hypothetical protein EPUS_02151 [Endocarpon pusillum Z07020]
MPLVDYSDSSSNPPSDEEAKSSLQASARKRKHKDSDTTQYESLRTKRKHPSTNNASTRTTSPSPLPLPSTALPTLPSTFHSLYASSVRTSTLDDPTLHAGRTRQTPHIEGRYPSTTELQTLYRLINSTGSAPSESIHTLLHSPLGAQTPLHISLSVPLAFQTHEKSLFLDSLAQSISTSNTKAFTVSIQDRLDWVPNFDSTRWFLALRLGQPEGDELNKLLKMCNEVVKEFRQPLLYERSEYAVREQGAGDSEHESRGGNGPRAGSGKKRRASVAKAIRAATAAVPDRSGCFHISIAWTLQDRGGTGNGGSSGMGRTNLDRKGMEITFDVVKVKLGNVVHDIPLAQSAAAVRTRNAMR